MWGHDAHAAPPDGNVAPALEVSVFAMLSMRVLGEGLRRGCHFHSLLHPPSRSWFRIITAGGRAVRGAAVTVRHHASGFLPAPDATAIPLAPVAHCMNLFFFFFFLWVYV